MNNNTLAFLRQYLFKKNQLMLLKNKEKLPSKPKVQDLIRKWDIL